MKKLTTLIALGTLVSALALNVSLAGAEVGGVTASGTNNAKITVTIADASADFGSNLDPSGIDSNSSDTALDYQGSSGNQGSFYVWKSGGMAVSVKSNKVWNGTVQAAENIGTSTSMSIASGVLTYVESSAPTTYAACSAGTAFATTASTWKSSVAKGSSAYTVYYCLRVDWDDDPGTFSSSITYTATQA
jgi:hypothetical protein